MSNLPDNENLLSKRVRRLEKESARQNIRIKELQRVVEVLVDAVHEMNQGNV